MADVTQKRWKLTTVATTLVLATTLVTTLVLANWGPPGAGSGGGRVGMEGKRAARRTADGGPRGFEAAGIPASGRQGADASVPVSRAHRPGAGAPEARPAGALPTQGDVAACNRHAAGRVEPRDKTWEVAKDALIGGAVTAGIGAAGGAIADGGEGAGKGAAIGGIVGAAAGTLYGIHENRKHDEAYRAAYAGCLRARGYPA